MVTYTLDKFGVPVDGGRQGPLKQPKLKYRYRVRFLNFGTIGNQAIPLTLNVQTCTLPAITHEEQSVHSYNSIAYYAGKASYGAIDVTAIDDVSNTVARNVYAQLQRQMDHYNQTGYRAATDYKFTTFIEMMDGGNDAVLEQWTGEGCFLVNTSNGDLSYSDSGPKMISMQIRGDNWTVIDEAGNRMMSTPSSDPQGRTL